MTKGKALTKFQERVEAEMTSLNPSAQEKVDQFIEAKLNKKLQEKQKTDKKAEAMEILQKGVEFDGDDDNDDDDELLMQSVNASSFSGN